MIERGEGMHVWDDQGNRYLDCFGGVLTVSVGHANPSVNKAIHAPRGASVLIKADPFGLAYRSATGAFAGNDSGPQLSLLAGTIVGSADPQGDRRESFPVN